LTVATLVLFVVLTALAIVRTLFWTYGADTGTFVQIVLDAFGGMRNGVEHTTHFRYHWSPALALLWPLVAATHALLALQIVQILATVATGPLLYLLVRPYLPERLAVRAGILALVYPPLVGIGFNEFHEVGLFAPLAVGMMLAADRRRWGWFALCTLAIAGLREDLCLEVAIAGAALAVAGTPAGRARAVTVAGLLAAAAGIATLAFYYGVLIPRLGPWVPAHFYVYPFADGPLALAVAPFVHPAAWVAAIVTFGRFTYLLEALLPLALLPFFSRWSLLALPGLGIVLLANSGLVWHMGMHYAAIWIPWLLIGAAFGVRNVMRRWGERVAARFLTTALAICAIVLIAFNPLHPLHYLKPNYHDLNAARAALACVAPNATVSTHDEWYTAIAARRPGATLQLADGPDYLVYADDFDNAAFQSTLLPAVRANVAAGRYRVLCVVDHVKTYQRTPQGAAQ
jgi:uncharacterized membrane protein